MKDHFELGCLNCVKRKTFTKECLLERDPKDCSDRWKESDAADAMLEEIQYLQNAIDELENIGD